jgi:5-(carboxyamino)imidazole ribonucleotide mutase
MGEAGAKSAALHAVAILALADPALAERLVEWRRKQTDVVPETPRDK